MFSREITLCVWADTLTDTSSISDDRILDNFIYLRFTIYYLLFTIYDLGSVIYELRIEILIFQFSILNCQFRFRYLAPW